LPTHSNPCSRPFPPSTSLPAGAPLPGSSAPPSTKPGLETAQVVQLRYSMEGLPEPLLGEIVKRITKTSDLNSLSLVSKQLCTVEAEHRDAIRVGRGLDP
uniref:F-box domain-containing protein n=1 Tax=Aegilops tauschii subsp. strangulata TaxID=200361 RepID=A0A453PNK1_AEGTS